MVSITATSMSVATPEHCSVEGRWSVMGEVGARGFQHQDTCQKERQDHREGGVQKRDKDSGNPGGRWRPRPRCSRNERASQWPAQRDGGCC